MKYKTSLVACAALIVVIMLMAAAPGSSHAANSTPTFSADCDTAITKIYKDIASLKAGKDTGSNLAALQALQDQIGGLNVVCGLFTEVRPSFWTQQ